MLEAFLQHFGYPAVFLDAFLEGEMSLVLAAYLALRGYLEIEPVMFLAFLGTYASDQFWYFLGRRHGRRILARRPRWQALADKTLPLVRRHPDLWVLCFRFIYGLRTVMPIALGLTGYPWGRYLALTAIGAGLWAAALGLAAYHIGAALEALLGDMRVAQLLLLGALVLLGVSLWLYRRTRREQD